MQHDAAVELLARAPLFRGLGGELLRDISAGGAIQQFCAGQLIVEAGLPADAALFIVQGNATLQDATGRDLE
ncbi:MAG: hypothetical protein ACE5FM_04915, partial [Methyloligellaceae bacterium]